MNGSGASSVVRAAHDAVAMYGFCFVRSGADDASCGPDDWPSVEVRTEVVEPTANRVRRATGVGRGSAVLDIVDGEVTVDRRDRVVEVRSERPLHWEEVVHPYLAFPAAALNHWTGNSTLHASGFVTDHGVVLVIGEKCTGKSTVAATAAAAGCGVMCDDLAVIHERSVLAGPRFIDLRPDVAARYGGRDIGVVGSRARFRVDLQPVPWSLPLAALVRLRVADRLRVERTSAASAATALFESFALGMGPGHADHVFDLLEVPMWDVERPLRLGAADDVLRAVLACASA